MTLHEKITSVQRWRHQIPLPGGALTPGSQDTLAQLPTLHLPEDLSGLSVLDIGCSDGFYSFECEKRGAARVLAVDNFSSVYIDSPVGFHVAHEILRSKVEFLQADLFDLYPSKLGKLDIIFFLGVLYHLRHPLLALERLAALCKRQFIMETEVAEPPKGRIARLYSAITGYTPPQLWMEFYPSDEINRDPTTWWAPTITCAEAMLRSCGFCGVQTVSTAHRRAVFHAFVPSLAPDPDRLVDEYGEELLAETCSQMTGRSVGKSEVVPTLRALSVTAFGRLKQSLAEARAKHWHQVERWKRG